MNGAASTSTAAVSAVARPGPEPSSGWSSGRRPDDVGAALPGRRRRDRRPQSRPSGRDPGFVSGAARVPTVWVDLDGPPTAPSPQSLDHPATMVIRGRGVTELPLGGPAPDPAPVHPYETIATAPDARHHGRRASGCRPATGRTPVAVLLHGGFWRERWSATRSSRSRSTSRGAATRPGISSTAASARSAAAGRRPASTSRPGSTTSPGWRTSAASTSAASSSSATPRGGHLALWAVKRAGAQEHASLRPGARRLARRRERPRRSGLARLRRHGKRGGRLRRRRSGRVRPGVARGAAAARRPAARRQGDADGPDFVDLSRLYAAAARAAGDEVELLELAGADHFHVITPTSAAWSAIAARVEEIVPP